MRIVFIHGPPAAGKLTIGSAVAEATGLRLFHNHLTVDLARSLFDFGSPGFVSLRETVWLAAFEQATENGVSFVFTFHPEASVRPSFIDSVEAIGARDGVRLDFVALSCAEHEVERRLDSASRSKYGKITSRRLYVELREQGAFEFPTMPEPALSIATDSTSVAESVSLIRAALVL